MRFEKDLYVAKKENLLFNIKHYKPDNVQILSILHSHLTCRDVHRFRKAFWIFQNLLTFVFRKKRIVKFNEVLVLNF